MALLEMIEAWSMWRSAKAAREIAEEQKRFNDYLIARDAYGHSDMIEPSFDAKRYFRFMEEQELRERQGFAGDREPIIDADFVPVEPTNWRLPAPSNDVGPLALPARKQPWSWWRRICLAMLALVLLRAIFVFIGS